MRVLVTGASGFVGRHLMQILRDSGHDAAGWSLGATASDVLDVDLTNPAQVGAHDLTTVDAVIHLAGLSQVSNSFDHPAEYVCRNASMEINLMEGLLRASSAARVLVVSTGAVYAGGHGLITEESPIRAANPYVVSKLAQEQLAHYYSERGLDVIIARPFNHIGPGQQRGFLVSDIACQIASLERSGGGTIIAGDLSTRRDFTDVRDVASAYLQLVTSGRRRETYNVCSGVTRSGRDIVNSLLRLTDVSIDVREDGSLRRPTETHETRAGNRKIRADTQWAPAIPLSATLSDTLSYWRDQFDQGSN